MSVKILVGDCRQLLRAIPAESAHVAVTSPPYYGLREYGVEPSLWGGDAACEHDFSREMLDRSRRSPGTQTGSLTGDGRYQATAFRFEIKSAFCPKCGCWRGVLGMEPDWRMYVEHMVEVFRGVRRVLRADGTLWLNLGDSYATGGGKVGEHPGGGAQGSAWSGRPAKGENSWAGYRGDRNAYVETPGIGPMTQPNRMPQYGLKPKDLMLIPSRVAIALQDDGWWVRSDIAWYKRNPMPESVTDRPTKSWEHVFLLAKSESYFYDAEAIAEPVAPSSIERLSQPTLKAQFGSERAPGKTNGPIKAVLKRSGNKERKPASARGVPVDTDGKTSGAVAGSIPREGTTRNKRDAWDVPTQAFGGEFCRACQTYFEGDALNALRVQVIEADKSGRRERRRWCNCGRHDAWLSHFATFPCELVEAPIKAGTSEYGCCAHCGSPWRRVTEREQISLRPNSDGQAQRESVIARTETVDWEPICGCAPQTVNGKLARAVVLDIFGGAGTTALVADRLGRDAIILELNPEYAEMARQRIQRDGGMFAAVEKVEPAREAAE